LREFALRRVDPQLPRGPERDQRDHVRRVEGDLRREAEDARERRGGQRIGPRRRLHQREPRACQRKRQRAGRPRGDVRAI